MYMLFILFLLCKFCDCQVDSAPDPQYVVNFISPVYVVGEGSSDYLDTSGIVCESYNESTSYMYGSVAILKEITGDLYVELILKKEASGKHEIVFSHDICEFCDVLGDLESDYQSYLQYMNIPDSCPLEAGLIEVQNLVVDMSSFEIKDQNCGEYMAELLLYKKTGDDCKKDRELILTMKIEIIIERKD